MSLYLWTSVFRSSSTLVILALLVITSYWKQEYTAGPVNQHYQCLLWMNGRDGGTNPPIGARQDLECANIVLAVPSDKGPYPWVREGPFSGGQHVWSSFLLFALEPLLTRKCMERLYLSFRKQLVIIVNTFSATWRWSRDALVLRWKVQWFGAKTAKWPSLKEPAWIAERFAL
jgi:hypothetical protein